MLVAEFVTFFRFDLSSRRKHGKNMCETGKKPELPTDKTICNLVRSNVVKDENIDVKTNRTQFISFRFIDDVFIQWPVTVPRFLTDWRLTPRFIPSVVKILH